MLRGALFLKFIKMLFGGGKYHKNIDLPEKPKPTSIFYTPRTKMKIKRRKTSSKYDDFRNDGMG